MKLWFLTWVITLAMIPALSFSAERKESGRQDNESSLPGFVGGVYAMDNSASGNDVWAFARQPDGSLTGPRLYPTGGLGTGSGLGNQGAVLLSHDGRWLFVCNAGSHE